MRLVKYFAILFAAILVGIVVASLIGLDNKLNRPTVAEGVFVAKAMVPSYQWTDGDVRHNQPTSYFFKMTKCAGGCPNTVWQVGADDFLSAPPAGTNFKVSPDSRLVHSVPAGCPMEACLELSGLMLT